MERDQDQVRLNKHRDRVAARRAARQAAGSGTAQKEKAEMVKVIITQQCTLDGKILQPGQEVPVPKWFARRLYRAERARPAAGAASKSTPASPPVSTEKTNG